MFRCLNNLFGLRPNMSPSCRFKLQIDDFKRFFSKNLCSRTYERTNATFKTGRMLWQEKTKDAYLFCEKWRLRFSTIPKKTFWYWSKKTPKVCSPLSLTVKWGFWRQEFSRQKLPEESMSIVVFTLGSSQSYVRHIRLHKFRLYRAFK